MANARRLNSQCARDQQKELREVKEAFLPVFEQVVEKIFTLNRDAVAFNRTVSVAHIPQTQFLQCRVDLAQLLAAFADLDIAVTPEMEQLATIARNLGESIANGAYNPTFPQTSEKEKNRRVSSETYKRSGEIDRSPNRRIVATVTSLSTSTCLQTICYSFFREAHRSLERGGSGERKEKGSRPRRDDVFLTPALPECVKTCCHSSFKIQKKSPSWPRVSQPSYLF